MDIDDNKTQRLESYRALVQQGLGSRITNTIRAATNKGAVLGGQKFIDRIGKETQRTIKFLRKVVIESRISLKIRYSDPLIRISRGTLQ